MLKLEKRHDEHIKVYGAHNEDGYFEDRRPAANMDPYQVCAVILDTVCGDY